MNLDEFIKQAEKIESGTKCKVRIKDTIFLNATLNYDLPRKKWSLVTEDQFDKSTMALYVDTYLVAEDIKWIKPMEKKKRKWFVGMDFARGQVKYSMFWSEAFKNIGPLKLVSTPPAFEYGRCEIGDIVVCKAHGHEFKILEAGRNTVVLSESDDFDVAADVNTYSEMKKHYFFKTNLKEEEKTPMWLDEITKSVDVPTYLREYRAYFKSDLELKIENLLDKMSLTKSREERRQLFIELAHWVYDNLKIDVEKLKHDMWAERSARPTEYSTAFVRGVNSGITRVGNYLTEQAIKIGLVEKA
jgi:hypothetical protein